MRKVKNKFPQEITTNAIIVDTNLLLLLLIGRFDKRIISTFSRLSNYTIEDYEYLFSIMKNKAIIITPNIITEISNLSGKLSSFQKEKFFIYLQTVLPSLPEYYIASSSVIPNPSFVKFGVTDAAIIDLAKRGISTLTSDVNLYYYMIGNGYDAYNFYHLRSPDILK